mmetsp:Transcript_6651/g.16320  ORF Transcript_6651/g.16320 Transcript_6651/m.16320 type:complete len:106 (+) Transcript_6651:1603-1920(+)
MRENPFSENGGAGIQARDASEDRTKEWQDCTVEKDSGQIGGTLSQMITNNTAPQVLSHKKIEPHDHEFCIITPLISAHQAALRNRKCRSISSRHRGSTSLQPMSR